MPPFRAIDTPRADSWNAYAYLRAALHRATSNLKAAPHFVLSTVRLAALWQLAAVTVFAFLYLPSRPMFLLKMSIVAITWSIFAVAFLVVCGGLLRSRRSSPVGWANRLTMIRFLLAGPLAALVLGGELVAGLIVYFACLLTDVIDGSVARSRHERSGFGTVLDPLADIVSTLALYGALMAQGFIPSWVFAVLVLRYVSLFVVGTAVFVAVGPVRFRATPIGKIVGVLQGAAGIMILALAGSDLQWQATIEVTLFSFLGIIFGSVILSQVIIAIGYVRDGAKCKILKAV